MHEKRCDEQLIQQKLRTEKIIVPKAKPNLSTKLTFNTLKPGLIINEN